MRIFMACVSRIASAPGHYKHMDTSLDTDIHDEIHENSQTVCANLDLKSKIEEALGPISKLPSDETLEHIRNLKV